MEGDSSQPNAKSSLRKGKEERPLQKDGALPPWLAGLLVCSFPEREKGRQGSYSDRAFCLLSCLCGRDLAKFVRPKAFLWEDAGLSSCSLAMIKVRLVQKKKGGLLSLPPPLCFFKLDLAV